MDENPILEHFQSPWRRGRLAGATHEHYLRNPACGDEVTLMLRVTDGRIEAAGFTASGCMVSQAATSMLCESIEGRTLEELTRFEATDMLRLIGIPLSPRRQQCGLLPFQALKTVVYSSTSIPES